MQLDSCYLFQKLSPSQIEQISAITREKQIQKGQWLFHEGQKATYIYLVKDGAVNLVINVEDNIEGGVLFKTFFQLLYIAKVTLYRHCVFYLVGIRH